MSRTNLARADRESHLERPAQPTAARGRAAPAARVLVREVAAPAPSRRRTATLLGIVLPLVAITIAGAGYYQATMAERVRHPLHAWLRPSGYLGQSAGLVALAIFVFLWLYPLRKRIKALAFTGSVARWLDVHVTAALTMPLLLGIHAAWRFEGLIGLGYGAILLVCASGVVGRYLYTRIPRTRTGVELTRDEVAAQRAALMDRIAATTQLGREAVERALQAGPARPDAAGLLRTLLELATNDMRRWRQARHLRRRWASITTRGVKPSSHALNEAVRLASREMALAQQVRMLNATHRVFRFWHVAHRPVALTALIAVTIHVVVVVAVGATWLW